MEEDFITKDEVLDYMEDVIKIIWKAKDELRSEFTAETTKLQVLMLRRFDTLLERVDEKLELRLKPIENNVAVLKTDVGRILKIVSNGKEVLKGG